MRHGIVEGEPGIFPQPIARLFQAIGRLFGRGRGRPAGPGSPGPGSSGPGTSGPGSPGRSPVEDVVGVPDVSDLDPVHPDRPRSGTGGTSEPATGDLDSPGTGRAAGRPPTDRPDTDRPDSTGADPTAE